MDLNTFLLVFLILSQIIVGIILTNQIKSQGEKIKNLEILNKSFKDYAELFDVERLKKYVKVERDIMEQDLELLRRRVTKETQEKVASDLIKNFDQKISEESYKTMNEMAYFIYWFFIKYMNQDTKMKEHIIEMFPESHEFLLGYFEKISIL